MADRRADAKERERMKKARQRWKKANPGLPFPHSIAPLRVGRPQALAAAIEAAAVAADAVAPVPAADSPDPAADSPDPTVLRIGGREILHSVAKFSSSDSCTPF
jgi:hypothetical protein